jgi:hypothetical protein
MKQYCLAQNETDASAARNGLCATCRHADTIASQRGSTFVLCRLSFTDRRFPKYPRLPVTSCAGYARREETGSA